MNEENPKNWIASAEHPSEDDLLCYMDGELSPKLTDLLRSHLEACWRCRSRAEKLQSAISLYIDFQSHVVQPIVEERGSWGGFNSRLQFQAANPIPPTFWERLTGSAGRLRAMLSSVDQRSLRLATISALTVTVIVAGVYMVLVSGPAVVSAEELIDRMIASRAAELSAAEQPVIYQQLRVRRRGPGGETTANVETWQDIDNLRMRKVVTPQADSPAPVVSDLEHILKANNYEPPPLSIIGFRDWRNTLPNRRDSVERIETEDGAPAMRLQTVSAGEQAAGRITLSDLTIRTADFHPVRQYFRVSTVEGDIEYEVRESSFSVMSLASLNAGFFADAVPMTVSARPSPKPSEEPSAAPVATGAELPAANTANTNTAVPNTIASADLEVEVMRLLNQAGADIDDQTDVKRTADGKLLVSGLVDTPAQKNRILQALASFGGNPAVIIRIETYTEAAARQKQSNAAPSTVERIEVNKGRIAAFDEVRRYLGKNEADAEEAVRRFSGQVLSSSGQLMSVAGTLKKLAGRFSKDEIKSMSPDARSKWLAVVRIHARTCEQEARKLRQQLQEVFGGSGDAASISIDSDTEIAGAAARLFNEASTADRAVRTAFTISSDNAGPSIKSQQFFRSLATAEKLAAALQAVR